MPEDSSIPDNCRSDWSIFFSFPDVLFLYHSLKTWYCTEIISCPCLSEYWICNKIAVVWFYDLLVLKYIHRNIWVIIIFNKTITTTIKYFINKQVMVLKSIMNIILHIKIFLAFKKPFKTTKDFYFMIFFFYCFISRNFYKE